MNILDRFRSKRNIPANASFSITQEGREKLQEFGGDPISRVLVALETRGTSDVEDITQASGLGKGQVERVIPKLVKHGFIQYLSAGMGEDE